MNLRAASLLLACVLTVSAGLIAEPRIERGRYFSPDNGFSIVNDPLYVPSYEVSRPDLTLVDFKFNPQIHQNNYVEARNIEWVTVASEVTPSQYEGVANDLINTYKTQRLESHNFTVVNAKLAGGARKPHYLFVAHGRQSSAVFLWQGAIFFFGKHIAMVSAVYSPLTPMEPEHLTRAMPDKSFLNWARSIRPEAPLTAQAER